MSDALRAGLEAAIRESPDDLARYRVLADHLTERGEKLGGWLSAQVALASAPSPEAFLELKAATAKQVAVPAALLWGTASSLRHGVKVDRAKLGLAREVTLDPAKLRLGHGDDVLAKLAQSFALRFATKVSATFPAELGAVLPPFNALATGGGWPSVRHLSVTGPTTREPTRLGTFEELGQAFPGLERLDLVRVVVDGLAGRGPALTALSLGDPVELTRAQFSEALRARGEHLRALWLWCTVPERLQQLDRLRPALEEAPLPVLESLWLSSASVEDAIAWVAARPFAKTLKRLGLTGRLRDLSALEQHLQPFAHLEAIDLGQTGLPTTAFAPLLEKLPNLQVNTGDVPGKAIGAQSTKSRASTPKVVV